MKEVFIAPDVFFRITPKNDIVLYKTSLQKVYLLGSEIYPILSMLSEGEKISDIYEHLHKSDGISETLFEHTLNQLIAEGILSEPTKLEERKRALEGQIKMSQYDDVHSLYSVMFELTYRCNERCKHCYCPRDNEVEKELTTDEIKGVICDLKSMGVVELTFTGGDLFVRDDTFEILEFAYSKGFVINIFTNGTLLKDDDFYRLKKLYPRSVHFSIYNYIPEKHDAFTRLPGSFKKTTDAIKKCKLLGIPVNIKVSLVDENRDDIEGIIKLARTLGTTIQISMQITPTNAGGMESTEHRLNNIETYAEIMSKVDSQILLSCEGDFISEGKKDTENAVCGAGAFTLSIDPYGEVYPCNALLMSCGNIRDKSISDIWEKSETLKNVRSFRISDVVGCEDCPNKELCDFCPGSAMQETGFPLERYSEACMLTEAKIIKKTRKEKNHVSY